MVYMGAKELLELSNAEKCKAMISLIKGICKYDNTSFEVKDYTQIRMEDIVNG